MYTVYKIECKPNGRIYYGRSQELEKRWRAHKNMLRNGDHNNFHLQEDWKKFGEDAFIFEVLHEFDNKDDSLLAEQDYIDKSRGEAYNISDSKIGGDTFTHNPRREEIREIHRQQAVGKNNPMYGKPKNDYTLQRIKEANSKPISIDGVIYKSLTQASKVFNVTVSTISNRIKSNSDQFKNWVFVDKEMPNDYRKHA
jgi:group I intron endonuclease